MYSQPEKVANQKVKSSEKQQRSIIAAQRSRYTATRAASGHVQPVQTCGHSEMSGFICGSLLSSQAPGP